MARLPSYRRLYEADFPQESQELVRQLSVSINAGFEQLFDVLNGKLTIEDNLASKVKTFQVMVNSSGVPTSNVSIKKATTDRISGLTVIRVDNLTNPTHYPVNAPFISFTETTDSVIVNNITGLTPNNSYQINVELLR